ncbi:hypothetical protein CYY_010409 [Polysphondylium violaceum]|uniref:DDE Tnp4 domain-containing protein n=1 Tax=Polysphondylium violaceum TaxID=133409 RepID=A0A8J4UZT0_9MYCE|nr:hypothetical protein CYY_010409 [Polysphondylium violaceum]
MIEILYPLAIENFNGYFSQRLNHSTVYNNGKEDQLITSVVDGSEQRSGVPHSVDQQNSFYSGKKKYSSITKLVYACPSTGKIMHMGESHPGSKNDMGLFQSDQVFLAKFNKDFEYIMGDKGFRFLENYYPKITTLQKGEKTEEKERIDKELKSIRIIIENVFAKIKGFWICSNTTRWKFQSCGNESSSPLDLLTKLHQIWCIIGFLINSRSSIRNCDE